MNKFIFKSIRIIRKALYIGTEKLDKIDERLDKIDERLDKIIKLLEEKENHEKKQLILVSRLKEMIA